MGFSPDINKQEQEVIFFRKSNNFSLTFSGTGVTQPEIRKKTLGNVSGLQTGY